MSPRMNPRRTLADGHGYDAALLWIALAILGLGLVMMASASLAVAERSVGEPCHYIMRQLMFVAMGVGAAFIAMRTPLEYLDRAGHLLLLVTVVLLLLVLVPGVGREVNGSARWLPFVLFNVQPSEIAKLLVVIFIAGYIVRRGEELRTSWTGFTKPMLLLGIVCILLIFEPDFGTTVVLLCTVTGMLFLGGMRFLHFGVLVLLAGGLMALVAVSSPYRLARLTTFVDPWADPFASGFQLTQALIAFGRGEWLGVGLGSSIQKLFYLPEAHTDFLFAVIAEELGFVGSLAVIALFALLVGRAFVIARRAERADRPFGAHLAYGIALWLGLQSFVNIGVNMGLLPTKGLTLPLMSYGGSSMIVTCAAVGLLLRVEYETRRTLARRFGGEAAW